MRFFHSIPLPLLLILCSIVSWGSPSALPADKQSSLASNRSPNDIEFFNSTFVIDNYDVLSAQYRRLHNSGVMKPLPLESNAVSEPNITASNDDISVDELQTALKSEEEQAAKLAQDIATAKGELTRKEAEASGPLKEYDTAREEWERLNGIYEDKSKARNELDFEVGNATKDWTDANAASDQINRTVADQEEIEAEFKAVDKVITDLRNNTALLAEATALESALATQIASLKTTVTGLSTAKLSAQQELNRVQPIFEGYQLKYDQKQCKDSADAECPEISRDLNSANATFQAAKDSLARISEQYNGATDKLKQMQADQGELIKRIQKYRENADEIDDLVDEKLPTLERLKKKLNALKPPLSETRAQKQEAAETLTKATDRLAQAVARRLAYPDQDLTADKQAAFIALATLKTKERIRNPLHKELLDMKNHLKDLEEQLERSNARVGALRNRIQAKTVKEKPGSAGVPIWLILVIAIVLPVCVALVVAGFFLRRRMKNNKKDPANETPTTNCTSSHVPTASTAQTKQDLAGQTPNLATETPVRTRERADKPKDAVAQDYKPERQDQAKQPLQGVIRVGEPMGILDLPPGQMRYRIAENMKPGSVIRYDRRTKIHLYKSKRGDEYVRVFPDGTQSPVYDIADYGYASLDLLSGIKPLCRELLATFGLPVRTEARVQVYFIRLLWHMTQNEFVRAEAGKVEIEKLRKTVRARADKRDQRKRTKKAGKARQKAGKSEVEVSEGDAKPQTSIAIAKSSRKSRKADASVVQEDPTQRSSSCQRAGSRGKKKTRKADYENRRSHDMRKRKSEERRSSRDMSDKSNESTSSSSSGSWTDPPSEDRRRSKYKGSRSRDVHTRNSKPKVAHRRSDFDIVLDKYRDDAYGPHVARTDVGRVRQMFAAEPKASPTREDLIKLLRDIVASVQSGTRYPFHEDVPLLVGVLEQAIVAFRREKKFVKLEPCNVDVVVVGDLHGNCDMLLYICRIFGGIESEAFKNQKFIFLGDYVDRGSMQTEVIVLLFILKILYPGQFILLRGNHECYEISVVYGFYRELKERMSSTDHMIGTRLHEYFCLVFSYMPLVSQYGSYVMMHGGIPRPTELKNLDEFNNEKVFPQLIWEVTYWPAACAVTWADPKYGIPGHVANARGSSHYFNLTHVEEFNVVNGSEVILRAHQVVHAGYEAFGSCGLHTIFSSANYEGKQNDAAVAVISPTMELAFRVLTALEGDPTATKLDDATEVTCADVQKYLEKADAHAYATSYNCPPSMAKIQLVDADLTTC